MPTNPVRLTGTMEVSFLCECPGRPHDEHRETVDFDAWSETGANRQRAVDKTLCVRPGGLSAYDRLNRHTRFGGYTSKPRAPRRRRFFSSQSIALLLPFCCLLTASYPTTCGRPPRCHRSASLGRARRAWSNIPRMF